MSAVHCRHRPGLPAGDGAKAGYVALLSVLIVSAIAATTVLVIFITGLGTSLSGSDVTESAIARMNADGCAERALQLLTNGSPNPCSAFCTTPTLTFGNSGSCTIVGITNTGGQNWRIRTTGSGAINTVVKYVEVNAFRSAAGSAATVLSWRETDGTGF